MGLPVVSCCAYLTSVDGIGWRPCDYDAHDFIHAIKGRPINGFANIPVRGLVRRLDDTNLDHAIVWFGQMIADVARCYDLVTALALVPVPNSRSAVGGAEVPRTVALARALAWELNRLVPADAVVVDVLRWSETLVPAHTGSGPRDPRYLFDRCRVTGDLTALRRRRIVLVDDVVTSGGHLQACAARLSRSGRRVELGIVAGRAGHLQVGEPFSVQVEEIADFVPASSLRA